MAEWTEENDIVFLDCEKPKIRRSPAGSRELIETGRRRCRRQVPIRRAISGEGNRQQTVVNMSPGIVVRPAVAKEKQLSKANSSFASTEVRKPEINRSSSTASRQAVKFCSPEALDG
jgi:hypothetical protein